MRSLAKISKLFQINELQMNALNKFRHLAGGLSFTDWETPMFPESPYLVPHAYSCEFSKSIFLSTTTRL